MEEKSSMGERNGYVKDTKRMAERRYHICKTFLRVINFKEKSLGWTNEKFVWKYYAPHENVSTQKFYVYGMWDW